jgi:hypothetical protein
MGEPDDVIDLGDYPHINTSGVADVYPMGDGRIRFLMFDWFKVDNVWRRVAVGLVTRPLANLREDQARVWSSANQPAPSPSAAPHSIQ